MDQQPDFLIIGYTNIDINITPTKQNTMPGGAAYFAAISASLISPSVGLVTRVGSDFDLTFLQSRINPLGIHIIANKPSARTTLTYYSNTDLTLRDITVEWNVAADICPEDIPNQWFKNVKYVHIGTMPPTQQAKFIPFIRSNMPQAMISIDTDSYLLSNQSNIALISDNFVSSDIIFVNRKEYKVLIETINTHPFVIFKADKEGAKIIKKGKEVVHVKTKPVEPVDVTGAGDILAGIFIASLSLGKTEQESLQTSVDLATKSITEEGVMHLFS